MAILIGKYTPEKKREIIETCLKCNPVKGSLSDALSDTETLSRLDAMTRATEGYQHYEKRGDDVDGTPFDESTVWYYEDFEVCDLIKDISELSGYVRNNPGANDREEQIDLLSAMCDALYNHNEGLETEQAV